MNLDTLLRDYARQDLQRFCPSAHYWLRDHDPAADLELVRPMLREPVRFGLTPQERVAADALCALATYEVRSQKIWSEAFPARDSGDFSAVEPMTLDQEREIYGRREAFRRYALVYARMLNDVQLIEHYQCETPIPGAREVTPTDEVVEVVHVVLDDADEKKIPDTKSSMSCPTPGTPEYRAYIADRHADLKRKGSRSPTKDLANEMGISDRAIRGHIGNVARDRKKAETAKLTPFGQLSALHQK